MLIDAMIMATQDSKIHPKVKNTCELVRTMVMSMHSQSSVYIADIKTMKKERQKRASDTELVEGVFSIWLKI